MEIPYGFSISIRLMDRKPGVQSQSLFYATQNFVIWHGMKEDPIETVERKLYYRGKEQYIYR